MPINQEEARAVAKQARSFAWQFQEGAISLSEFMYAAAGLYAANKPLIDALHDTPGSEWRL